MRQTIYPEAVIPERAGLLSEFYGVGYEDLLENNEIYRHLDRIYDHDIRQSQNLGIINIAIDRRRLRAIDRQYREQGQVLGSTVLEFAMRCEYRSRIEFLEV